MRLAEELRLAVLQQRNPGATRQELIAILTEERYRDSVDPSFLKQACAAIRAYRPDDHDAA